MSQFLKLVATEDLNCFVEPLQLMKKELIVLAVNNANDPSVPGGSHWSLLVYTLQVCFDIYFIFTLRNKGFSEVLSVHLHLFFSLTCRLNTFITLIHLLE